MHATHQIIKGLGHAHRKIQHLTLNQHSYLKEMIKWQADDLIEPAVILQKSLQSYLERNAKSSFDRKMANLLLSENSLNTTSDYVLFSIKLLNKHHSHLQAGKFLEMLSAFFSLYRYYEIYLNEGVIQKLTLIDIFIENIESEIIRLTKELAKFIAKDSHKDKNNRKLNACLLLRSYINLPVFKKVSMPIKQGIITHILSLLMTNKEDELLRKSAVYILSKLRKHIDKENQPDIMEKILTLCKQHPNAEHWHLLRKFYHYFLPSEQEAVTELIFQLLPTLKNTDHLIVYDFLSLLKRMPPEQQKILLPPLLNFIDNEMPSELLAGSFLNLLFFLRNKVHEDSQHIVNEYIKGKITPFNVLWYESGVLRRTWRKLKAEEKITILHELQSRLSQDSRALIALNDVFGGLPFEAQLISFHSIQQIDYSKNPQNCLSNQARLKITATIFHRLESNEKQIFLKELKDLLAKNNNNNYKQMISIIKRLNANASMEVYKNLREDLAPLLRAKDPINEVSSRVTEKMRLGLIKKSITLADNEGKQKIALNLFESICKPPHSQLTRLLATITPCIPHLDYPVKIALLTRLMSLPSKLPAHGQLYSLLYNACEVDVKLSLLQRSAFFGAQTNLQSLPPEVISHVAKFMF